MSLALAYNTQEESITLKEYGRNIQNIAMQVVAIEDDEKRKAAALNMVELMKQLNPSLKESPEYGQKIWNDVNIITGYNLNVQHPRYETPLKHEKDAKPQTVGYPVTRIKYKHYGHNLELLIDEASELEEGEEKENAKIYLARLMKRFFESWNKNIVDDEVIVDQLKALSRRKLQLDLDTVRAERLLVLPQMKEGRNSGSSNYKKKQPTSKGGRPTNSNNNNRNKRKQF